MPRLPARFALNAPSAGLSWTKLPDGLPRLHEAIRQASDPALAQEIEQAHRAGVDLRPAVVMALDEQRLDGFQDLVGRTGDLNAPNRAGSSLLMLAILGRRSLQIAQWLIDHGADVHHTNRFGEDALSLACHENATSLVPPLLAAGVNPNVITPRGTSALSELLPHHLLARTVSPALRALAQRATPEVWAAQDPNGLTPLMQAYGLTRNGPSGATFNDRLIQVLLDHGAGIAMKIGDDHPQRPSPWTLTANDAIRRQTLERGFSHAIALEQDRLRATIAGADDPSGPVLRRPRL